jgi:ADP-ribosylglycohydrolase
MLSTSLLRSKLRDVISNKEQQGHVVDGLHEKLDAMPDSLDALSEFARSLSNLPVRDDWPYVEPDELDAIWAECDGQRPTGAIGEVDLEDCARRVEAAFLASVCGCVLGKPLEVNPNMEELQRAFEPLGEWPLRDYVPEAALENLHRRHESWPETTRGNIRHVAPDDDMNYTVLGMLLLEKHGLKLNKKDVRAVWINHVPLSYVWGPERTLIAKAALWHGGLLEDDVDEWANVLNWNDELCGAQIRADAYGYACPGRPALAAQLAWVDASWTHRKTGTYATMWTAAAIAAAQVERDPLRVFEIALQFVPQRSRFHKIVSDSLNEVAASRDFYDGYARIHGKYKEYSHCRVYQESGTLINTLRWAESVGDGIGKQVMQGNDTDSYGATAGSLLGCFFGPGHLEDRWLAPFNDDIHTSLSSFFERSLSKLARRMGELPQRIAHQL